MTPRDVVKARHLRRQGVSDAVIGRSMTPPVSRQAVHLALGPRPRRPPRAAPATPAAPTREAFATALRTWRIRRGLSQAAAARLLRVTTHSVESWEIARCGCSLAATVLLLLDALDRLDR